MENATKALLIAAGILFGLMIISLSLVMRNNVSSYYENMKNENIRKEIATFNGQYLIYQKDDLRGNDLVSLINKVLDFNTDKADEEPPIELLVEKIGVSNIGQFCYNGDSSLISLNKDLTHNDFDTILTNVKKIESDEGLKNKRRAEKLASDISNALVDASFTAQEKNYISQYYQYMHFKRAHFECEVTNFTDTGRVQRFKISFNGEIE